MTDRARWLLAALFLIAFISAALSHAVRTSATFDEPPHLAAGYVYGRFDDYRLNPEHPPLFKRLAALPWRWSSRWPNGLELDRPAAAEDAGRLAWAEARRAFALAATEVDAQWLFAHTLLYSVRDTVLERAGVEKTYALDPRVEIVPEGYLVDTGTVLLGARTVTILAGLLLISLIALWAYRLHGADGALLALALAAFDPNLVAHGSLITTDVPFTVLLVAAVYALWRAVADPGRQEISLPLLASSLVAAGLAMATKFSAVVLLPLLPLLLAVAVLGRGGEPSWRLGRWRGRLLTRRRQLAAAALLALCAVVAGGTAIWASYGWRYQAASDDAVRLPVELTLRRARALELLAPEHPDGPPPELVEKTAMDVELGLPARLLIQLDRWQAVPEAFAFGLAEAERKAQSRTAFLHGEISSRGFPSYFLWTFLLKTPLITLVLISLTGLFLVRGRRRLHRVDLLFLLLPVVIYALFAFSSRLNIGHRHLLPLYPFLYVLSGCLLTTPRSRSWTPVVLGLVVLGSSLVFVPALRPQMVHPHHLAYFNELAGGPARGSESLVDSNLDWGQDLPALAAWIDENGIEEPIALCYFGTADPRRHGIRFVNLPGGYPFAPPFGGGSFAVLDQPGYLAISATHVRGVYFDPILRASWRQRLAGATPIATAGRSIFIYRLEP